MSLADQASLLLIPSGYKSQKVYSIFPTDGDGDFDFSRSGSATRIAKNGLITTVDSNIPRLEYPMIDGVQKGCPSLILEPQRTNLLAYSEDFSNAYWSKLNTTINSNTSTSPDGTTNASLIYPTTSGTDRLIEKVSSATSGQIWTSSFFVKASGFSWVLIYAPNLGVCWFNASTGIFGDVASGVTAIVLGQVNDFWRISFTATLGSNNAYFYAGVADSNGTTFATTSGTSGVYIYGAQLEQGSYPTSYIKSNSGSTTTRQAETCDGAGDAATFNDSEGVLMFEGSSLANDGTSKRVGLSDGSTSNRVSLEFDETANTLKVFVSSGGVGDGTLIYVANNLTSFNKIAISYKLNDLKMIFNGFLVDLDTSVTAPIGLDNLSFNNGTGALPFYGKTKQIQYYNSALTDSELEQLTSWTSFTDMAEGQLYTIE
jgi:hypothetical protein